MNTQSSLGRTVFLHVALLALALPWLGVIGCFRTPDPAKLKCKTQAGCPSGFMCTVNGCEPIGTVGGTGGQVVPPGNLDGAIVDGAKVDGDARRLDGAGGSSGRLDGAPLGGTVEVGPSNGGATGGASTGTGGAVAGGAGGVMLGGSGGVVIVGSGGSVAPDAPGATGGTTSVLDAPIRSDAADAPASSANGSPCTTDGQCSSTHCVDGVCCATTCTGCNACTYAMTGMPDGTCSFVSSGKDPHETCADETVSKPCGNDGMCDGKGACRKVGAGQKCGQASCSADGTTFSPEPKCDGNGTCSPGTSETCTPYPCAVTGCAKTCSKQSDCNAGTYCDTGLGTCATQKANGTPATQPYECTSNVVADGVCCDKDCAGCSACTAALNGQAASTTGRCLPVIAAKAPPATHAQCAAAPPCGLDGTCDGSGACRYTATATPCGTSSCTCDNPSACAVATYVTNACDSTHNCAPASSTPCAGSLVCASATACKTGSCTQDADCLAGRYCAGGTCTTKKTNGTTCLNGNECSTGKCVDGYCCNDACAGTCQSCRQTPGTCRTVTTPRTSCGGTGTCGTMKCDGTHAACVYPGAEVSCPSSCSTDLASLLTSTCNGAGACGPAQSNSCGSAAYCSGSQCTSKLPNGTAGCPANVACSSSNCSTYGGNTMCCASGLTNCSQGCYNLNSDPKHCGNCASDCGPNQVCNSTVCNCASNNRFTCGSCTSWNFESGTTEGWQQDPWYTPTTTPTVGTPPAGRSSGSYSLKFTLNGGGSVYVPLCFNRGTTTGAQGISMWIYMQGSTPYPAWKDMVYTYLDDGSQSGGGTGLQLTVTNQWKQVYAEPWSSGCASANWVGLWFAPSSSWSGTVYVDDISITPC